jgi:F0F1-type ATP synthase assembly protein I
MAANEPAGSDSGDEERRLKKLRQEYMPAGSSSGGSMATAGIELGLIFIVLALGGWWLDRKLGTSPWLLLLGCLIGIVGGLYRLIRNASRQ